MTTQQAQSNRVVAPSVEEIQAAVSSGKPVLFLFIDMSRKKWKLAFSNRSKEREDNVPGGDFEKFAQACSFAKQRLKLPTDAPVAIAYEAGQDGFFPHRRFLEMGFCSMVVDPASIELSRRKRVAKTDLLDAKKGVRHLIRYLGGEKKAWSVVYVPTVAEEDARRVHRERERLLKERIAHSNRVVSLLTLHGVRLEHFGSREAAIESGIPPNMRLELERECQRLKLVQEQLQQLERERVAVLEEQARTNPIVAKIVQLMQLSGIGMTSAWLLVFEFFGWRKFNNRREVGGAVGLTGTPFDSGEGAHEQGISKAGNWRVRGLMIELAWGWLRFQPESALSHWFMSRWGSGAKRGRRVGIVAMARRLLIDLWRYVERGVVPKGARLKPQRQRSATKAKPKPSLEPAHQAA